MLKYLYRICFIFIHLAYSQDISDYNKQSPNLSHLRNQQYVYHTNSNLWMGWDNYGNTGDQTCSAIIPGWVYPGGSGLNYNCRAGYWIIANIGGALYEGTTGQYDITEGTEPGQTSSGWAGSDGDYNKEPWVTTTTWSIPSASLDVVATRRSWSFQGTGYNYYKIGEHDYNDFVIDEIQVINNGSATVDEIVLGSKADHDVTWNVPNPDWDYAFWTDDIVDYDEETFLTMQLDGDDPGSAANDFGIDDPGRQYRGVRVGQAPLNIAGTNYSSLSQSDVNHMWWTGDEDPQTVASRYAMATMVSGTGDKKNNNPTPMDMRYLQSYSEGSLAAGDTATFLMAVVAGSGLENVKQAVFNARKAYDWDWNLPKPPAAPQMTNNAVEALSDGNIKVSWSYSDAQIATTDPDKGADDFAGFRIYRSVSDSVTAADLFSQEGITIEPEADIDQSTPYYPNQSGPFTLVADIPFTDLGTYSNGDGTYTWTDDNTVHFSKHWYYVAAYDEAGTDAVHGSVPSLESYYTMCYPMVQAPDGSGELIPGINMNTVIPYSEDYSVLSGSVSGTLSLAESPYFVLDDAETSSQVTIESGVEIIFASDVSLSGSFNAQGSETDSIRFYNMNNQINGVIINTGISIFSYCAFDVGVRSDGGPLAIEHSGSFTINALNTALNISYSNPGLYADYCTGNITNNTFDNFSSFNYCNDMLFENNVFKNDLISSESNNITFKRNLFLGNSSPTNKWDRMFWLISDTNVTIINNTFSDFEMSAFGSESSPSNIIGIMDNGTSLDIDIRNNIFWNISDTTNACIISYPYGTGSSVLDIEYNNIQGGADEVYGVSLGTGNINEDPLFTDSENGDYTLQLGSPCIDTGDPDLDGDGILWESDEDDQDLDGTRMDIGSLPHLQEDIIYLSVDSVQGFREDTILVSVNVTIPDDITFSSSELSFDGFYDNLEFLDVKTEGGLIDSAGWSLYVNETDSLLISASGGANTISGMGILFWLRFAVPDTAMYGFVPVNVTSAIFDESDLTIIYTNGGIQVRVINYGDVSLDGEIHAYDASLILKHLVNLVNLDFQQIENANVSLDATISALDASLIFQYVVELLDSLPYDTSITANGILSMHDGEFDPNQLVEVPLHLTGGDNIYSFEMEIDYDSTALTFSDINWSSELDQFTIEANLINGRLSLAGAGSTPDGQETIFSTINFAINDNYDGDETMVSINQLRWNEEEIIENVATATLSRALNLDGNYLPVEFSLHQNYPNPFNPVTTLRYDLPEQATVNITIYNMIGREVKTLINQTQDAGYRSIIWDATNDYGKPVGAGIYLYHIQAGEYISTKKMVLLK